MPLFLFYHRDALLMFLKASENIFSLWSTLSGSRILKEPAFPYRNYGNYLDRIFINITWDTYTCASLERNKGLFEPTNQQWNDPGMENTQ